MKEKKAGMEEGIQEGIKEGIAEGERKQKQAIAHNLLKLGIDLKTIFESTGLTEEEIKNEQRSNSGSEQA